MKKLIGLLAVVLISSAATAQGVPSRYMTPEQLAAMIRERLKDANLTPAQTDSVIAIYFDRSMMDIRDMPPEERQAKMKEWNKIRAKRMAKAGIPEEQIKKVMDILTTRPGGGRGGGR